MHEQINSINNILRPIIKMLLNQQNQKYNAANHNRHQQQWIPKNQIKKRTDTLYKTKNQEKQDKDERQSLQLNYALDIQTAGIPGLNTLNTNRLHDGFQSRLQQEKSIHSSQIDEVNRAINNYSSARGDHRDMSKIATDYIFNGLAYQGPVQPSHGNVETERKLIGTSAMGTSRGQQVESSYIQPQLGINVFSDGLNQTPSIQENSLISGLQGFKLIQSNKNASPPILNFSQLAMSGQNTNVQVSSRYASPLHASPREDLNFQQQKRPKTNQDKGKKRPNFKNLNSTRMKFLKLNQNNILQARINEANKNKQIQKSNQIRSLTADQFQPPPKRDIVQQFIANNGSNFKEQRPSPNRHDNKSQFTSFFSNRQSEQRSVTNQNNFNLNEHQLWSTDKEISAEGLTKQYIEQQNRLLDTNFQRVNQGHLNKKNFFQKRNKSQIPGRHSQLRSPQSVYSGEASPCWGPAKSKLEKTEMLEKPVQSFYHHYQRPVSQANNKQDLNLFGNSIQSTQIPLQDKYEKLLRNLEDQYENIPTQLCNNETQIDIPPLNIFEDPKFDHILIESFENTLKRKDLDSKLLTIETQQSKRQVSNPTQMFDSSFDVTHLNMTSKLRDPTAKETISINALSDKKGQSIEKMTLNLSPLEKEQLVKRFKKVYEEQFHNLNVMNNFIIQSNINNMVNNMGAIGDSTGRSVGSGLNIDQIKQLLNEEVIMRQNWKPEIMGLDKNKMVRIQENILQPKILISKVSEALTLPPSPMQDHDNTEKVYEEQHTTPKLMSEINQETLLLEKNNQLTSDNDIHFKLNLSKLTPAQSELGGAGTVPLENNPNNDPQTFIVEGDEIDAQITPRIEQVKLAGQLEDSLEGMKASIDNRLKQMDEFGKDDLSTVKNSDDRRYQPQLIQPIQNPSQFADSNIITRFSPQLLKQLPDSTIPLMSQTVAFDNLSDNDIQYLMYMQVKGLDAQGNSMGSQDHVLDKLINIYMNRQMLSPKHYKMQESSKGGVENSVHIKMYGSMGKRILEHIKPSAQTKFQPMDSQEPQFGRHEFKNTPLELYSIMEESKRPNLKIETNNPIVPLGQHDNAQNAQESKGSTADNQQTFTSNKTPYPQDNTPVSAISGISMPKMSQPVKTGLLSTEQTDERKHEEMFKIIKCMNEQTEEFALLSPQIKPKSINPLYKIASPINSSMTQKTQIQPINDIEDLQLIGIKVQSTENKYASRQQNQDVSVQQQMSISQGDTISPFQGSTKDIKSDVMSLPHIDVVTVEQGQVDMTKYVEPNSQLAQPGNKNTSVVQTALLRSDLSNASPDVSPYSPRSQAFLPLHSFRAKENQIHSSAQAYEPEDTGMSTKRGIGNESPSRNLANQLKFQNSKEMTHSTVGANSGLTSSPRRSIVFGRRSPQKASSPKRSSQKTHVDDGFTQTQFSTKINKIDRPMQMSVCKEVQQEDSGKGPTPREMELESPKSPLKEVSNEVSIDDKLPRERHLHIDKLQNLTPRSPIGKTPNTNRSKRSQSIEVGKTPRQPHDNINLDNLVLVQELIENQMRIDKLEKGIKQQFGQKSYLGPKTQFMMNKQPINELKIGQIDSLQDQLPNDLKNMNLHDYFTKLDQKRTFSQTTQNQKFEQPTVSGRNVFSPFSQSRPKSYGNNARSQFQRSPKAQESMTISPKIIDAQRVIHSRGKTQFGLTSPNTFRQKLQTADQASRGQKKSFRATYTPQAKEITTESSFQTKNLQMSSIISSDIPYNNLTKKHNSIISNFKIKDLIKKSTMKNKLEGRCQTRFKFLGIKNCKKLQYPGQDKSRSPIEDIELEFPRPHTMQARSVFMPEGNQEIEETFRVYEQKAYENSLIQKSKQRKIIHSSQHKATVKQFVETSLVDIDGCQTRNITQYQEASPRRVNAAESLESKVSVTDGQAFDEAMNLDIRVKSTRRQGQDITPPSSSNRYPDLSMKGMLPINKGKVNLIIL